MSLERVKGDYRIEYIKPGDPIPSKLRYADWIVMGKIITGYSLGYVKGDNPLIIYQISNR